jgi:type VI secretion system secreted protein Hcp
VRVISSIAMPRFVNLVIVILALAVSGSAFAGLDAYLWITGETQGQINGSVTQAGREGSMQVVEFAHNVSQIIDTASGLPSGKRQHRPIRVTKPVDKASPLLANAQTSNENLTSVRIDFWRPNINGSEEQFYTVELVNARITSISQHHGSTPELLAMPTQETVTLVYDKIIWTWQDGGITAEDDWVTPTP